MVMRKRIACLSLALSIMLSGCSAGAILEKKMVAQAGVADDSDYQTYQAYEADGKITPQGYYSEDVFEAENSSETIPSGTALVSFSRNSYLVVSYYSDAEHTESIEPQSCYLKPGTSIYATVEISRDVASSMYSFAGFRLYQFKNGGRDLIDTIQLGEAGFVLEVTKDMVGSDFAIEPIGDYGSRTVTLHDYYIDDDGKEQTLSGTWLIDDKVVSGNEVEINPVASYIISYEYDNSEFFYLSSNPQCYYSNNEDGVVIFELMEATDESFDYSIELCRYISVEVETSSDRTISLNGANSKVVNGGTKYIFTGLKYGDSLNLITNIEWPQLEKCKELIVNGYRLSNGAYEYRIIVPDKDGQFLFDPNEYTYEHGEIGFKWLGEEITGPIQLAKGRVITYYDKRVDPGYWLPEGDRTITIGDEQETRIALNSISFEPIKKVTVSLSQPAYGGTIKYFIDGKEIKANSIETTTGTKISMQFDYWPGWITHYKNGEVYEVTEAPTQTIQLADTAFSEDEDHKPALEVVLKSSVGEKMTFAISAADLSQIDCRYSGNWIGSDNVVLSPTKIGTYDGINLAFGNRSLEAGTAVKVLVEMVDTKGNKSTYSRLVNNLAEKQAPIMIYDDAELGVSEVWYKTIKITISVVEVETFSAPHNPAHGTVTVRVADSQTALRAGDLIEPAEKVTVTIAPNSDYYVTGKNVKNDIYQEEMKFSDYLKKVNDIISAHSIEKYIHLSLAASDQYGNCAYMLDNNAVSGSIRVKSGQTLKLTYTITADGYVIEGGSSGFLGIGKTDTEITESLTITADWDGKTIDRSSVGINVVKGE